MLHQLTVDPRYCRGLHLCHQCEALQPGLVEHCKTAPVVIQEWAAREQGSMLSALVACCPNRAIHIKPID